MFLSPVDDQEIIRTVQNCKNKKSTNYSDINMSLIKNVITKIVQPFGHICNVSFHTGVFPNKMKNAKVVPLFKCGEKNVFTNYRPKSLLPQFSKFWRNYIIIGWKKSSKSMIYSVQVSMVLGLICQLLMLF